METLCPSVQSSGEAARDELTVGGILRAFLPLLLHLLKLSGHKLRVLWQLAACGTPALGANLFHCPHCQHRHWAPRSCGNRHCPRCLAAKSWQWLEKQTRSLLPITYYHCVFTLPAELNSLMLANQRRLYPLLFDCAAQSLLEFGHNRLHGDLGITAVLHTWGQKLEFHPHLHCIVTGGALSPNGKRWRSPKQRKFLFPVQAVAALFRGKFLAGLRQMLDAGELHLPDSELKAPANRARWFSLLYSKRWVLYAKRPFGGPQQVLSYLANYTHRVALSNRRIVAVDAQHQSVTFTYRNYRHGSQRKELTLSALEFIRRFSLHILPPGLVRIRHYGILGNNRRKRDIEAARAIFKCSGCAVELQPRSVADKPMCCPSCGKAGIRLVAFTDAAGVLHMIGTTTIPCDSS
jgi:putative transposase/transposase-like zinc-binding protein